MKHKFPVVQKVSLQDLMDCKCYNQAHQPLNVFDISWEMIRLVIEDEEDALKQALEMSPEEGDEFLFEGADLGLQNEIGVNAAIMGLTLAGCLTVTSCRGGKWHTESPSYSRDPSSGPAVCFYINPILAPVLAKIVGIAGLKIEASNLSKKMAIITSRVDDTMAMLRLARLLCDVHGDIDALGDARHVLSLADQTEYIKLLEEYDGDDNNSKLAERIASEYGH